MSDWFQGFRGQPGDSEAESSATPAARPAEGEQGPVAGSSGDSSDTPAARPPEGGQRPPEVIGEPHRDPEDRTPDRSSQWPRRTTGSSPEDPAEEGAVSCPPQADVTAASTSEPAEATDVSADPLGKLARERDEYKDALVRLQADFENYRKRILKQQTEHLERAAEGLVVKLLPVLDTADLARAHGGGEEVDKITEALHGALEQEGLERIEPEGGPFDPKLHDAVLHEPGDGSAQEVAEVMRAGYRWKGKVLRPAMVRVRG